MDRKERARWTLAVWAAIIIFGITLYWGYDNSTHRNQAEDQVADLSAQLHATQRELAATEDQLKSATTEASNAQQQASDCLTTARKEITSLRLAARYLASSQVNAPPMTQPPIAECKRLISSAAISGLTNAVYETKHTLARIETARQPVVIVVPPPSPSGATAICWDCTYSYSQHHSGTCSWHGGVKTWL